MSQAGQYKRLFDLSGRNAVVTGAGGILGRIFAAALADHGASLVLVDRDAKSLEPLAEELRETYGVRVAGFGCDLADQAAVRDLCAAVEDGFGPVDILHNNAASKGSDLSRFFDPIEDYSPEVWREVMAVNLDGAFFVAQAFGSRMVARRRGSIIQTASIYGVVGPDQRIYEGSQYMGMQINTPPVYSASKAGLIGLTHYLASMWGEHNVRVNTLTPGGVSSGQNTVFQDRYSARIPMRRMAQAEEMTGALVYLASDASSYVTGQNIVIDGGLTAW